VSLEWGDLLNGLAIGSHRSLVILTSREFPADLADRRLPNAKPNRALVRVETVEQVDEMSAIEILQEYGMQDSSEDLAWIARQVDGHPIYLQLLAANYGDRPGYLRKHPQELAGGLDGELAKQWLRQSEAAWDLARRLCVLRVAINVQGLTFLRLYSEDDDPFGLWWEGLEFTSEEIAETAAILDCLVRGSLVQRQYDTQKCVDEFSMHRVIVEFLERQLGEARSGLLGSVYQFYRSGRTVENPRTLEDLQPLLEAQFFAFQLGNYSEAENLIYELEKYLDPWGYWALKKELCEQVLPHLPRASQPYILQRIGFIYRGWGDWNQAETYYQQALDLAQAGNDRGLVAGLQGNLGDIERNRGNWDEAERLYRQSLELRTELGDRSGMASSWGLLGDIEQYRGNWDEAERLYRQKLETCEELGDRSGMAAVIGTLGDIERNRGNWDEAERLFHQCLEMTTELGDRSGMATSWGVLGDIERNRGNWDEAEEYKQKSFAVRKEIGDRSGMASSLGAWASIKIERGDYQSAQLMLKQKQEICTDLGDSLGLADAIGGLGVVALKREEYDLAEQLLESALSEFERLNARYESGEYRFALAQLWQRRNNPDRAQHHYTIARDLYTQLGAAKDLDRIQTEFNPQ
jgi:tetratricopeptide (TPR) repeat protein